MHTRNACHRSWVLGGVLVLALLAAGCGQNEDVTLPYPSPTVEVTTPDPAPGQGSGIYFGTPAEIDLAAEARAQAELAAEIEAAHQAQLEREAAEAAAAAAAGDTWVRGVETIIAPGSRALYHQPEGANIRVITDIRVGAHDGFDRVVFDLAGGANPGWFARFVDAAHDDGSGLPVDVPGQHILELRLAGMAFPEESDAIAYDGAAIGFGGTALNSVIYRFWFEGYITVFIGIDGPTQPLVTITALDGPPRVMVDIAH
ncbi:MAG: hypothetical protein FWD83_05300 [Promicromonosporaceae bacterium]|nr:hypothetical protein [Promicromonosporaceae bacterium]